MVGRADQPVAQALVEHHEGEFAAQPQHAAEHQRAARGQPGQPADAVQQGELDHQQGGHAGGDQPRLGGHAGQVDAHAHGDEEQAQQQPLERLDLRFQLVAEFRIGQQHAGQERAQARAQPGLLHEPGIAQHHQQRAGGEHLGHAGARDRAEQVAQHEAPAQHHQGDGADRLGRGLPGQGVVVGRSAEQRDRGQQRDRDEVLEQQDREGQPAEVGVQFLALGQQLQAHRGGGQGQGDADHDRALPFEVAQLQPHHHRQHRRGDEDLQAAGAEDRLAHQLQARRRQLQADHEQQHHHADLGGVEDAVGVLHEAQPVRPQHHPGHQVGEHGAQAEPLEHGHGDDRRQQQHQRQFQTATTAVHARTSGAHYDGAAMPVPPAAARPAG